MDSKSRFVGAASKKEKVYDDGDLLAPPQKHSSNEIVQCHGIFRPRKG